MGVSATFRLSRLPRLLRRPDFQTLRARLAVLYAGLFGVVMVLIAAAVFVTISARALSQVQGELRATATVFDRIWTLRADQLTQGASILARDFGFREAVATQDQETVISALENLKARLELEEAFILGVDGQVVGARSDDLEPKAFDLVDAFYGDDATAGVLVLDHRPFQVIAAPVMAPDLRGWLVFATPLDAAQMDELEKLAAIPLTAMVLHGDAESWSDAQGPVAAPVARQIAVALASGDGAFGDVKTWGGDSLAVVRPLRSLTDSDRAVLVLRYPLALALAPYGALMGWLLALGLAGLATVIGGSWLLARNLSRPLMALDQAAQRLRMGEDAHVEAEGRDEIARLGRSFNAMADEIRERERRITHLALHDAETGLPNRLALEQHIEDERHRRGQDPLFVAVVRIDRFAKVRGAIGYRLAGEMVRKIGDRLRAELPGALVGRIASDALGLAIRAPDEAGFLARAEALRHRLQTPLELDGEMVDVELTCGVAPLDERTAAFLIDRANIAVDQAAARREPVGLFDPVAYGDPSASLGLMSGMLSAITAGHMTLFHQPKYDLRGRRINAVESLIRWRHPERGMIRPDHFIPMAEETGHIRALTDWVLHQAIADQAALAAQGLELAFSINVSGRLLGDRDFAQLAVEAARGAAGKLCFEITETAVIENPETALRSLDLWTEAGIEISIDDFGSGLSSLAYLKQIKGHELKLDRALVVGVVDSHREALIVRSTVDLAHGLGMKVTAEGVETQEIATLLTSLGCDSIQGYLIGKPMPLDELRLFLTETDAPAAQRA